MFFVVIWIFLDFAAKQRRKGKVEIRKSQLAAPFKFVFYNSLVNWRNLQVNCKKHFLTFFTIYL